ncbi:MAG: LON peptidase substrate-binding domain-containing protein [Bacteroidota bacterium]
MFLSGSTSERPEGQVQLAVTEEDATHTDEANLELLPLLAIDHGVLFPGVILPMSLQNQQAINFVRKVYKADGVIGVVAQKKSAIEKPGAKDVFHIGTIAKILKIIPFPAGHTTAILQGKQRFQVEKFIKEVPHLLARVRRLREYPGDDQDKKVKALTQSVKEVAAKLIALHPEFPAEAQATLDKIKELSPLTYFLASGLSTDIKHKQKLLETHDSTRRGTLLLEHLLKDLEMSRLRRKIQDKVHTDISQQQRDYYIRHQIRALQDELGEDPDEEINELRAKGEKKNWPDEIADHFYKELNKAERLSAHNPDYSVIINHAELLVDLPWGEYNQDNTSLRHAEEVLNADHYGIEKVKERLLEYLAVLKLKQTMKGPILCLYGPPGVGKTSLGKSIAKALNRKYTRISLGGLHDEAEIRGHRKTYVGAMPGKLIRGIQKGGSSNPVFVLDEIDKLNDMRGDPSSALL